MTFYNCKYFDQMFTFLSVTTIADNRFIKKLIKSFTNAYKVITFIRKNLNKK